MEQLKTILKDIFKNTSRVTDKTPRERIDNVDIFKCRYINGIDVRVSIDQLKVIQDWLK